MVELGQFKEDVPIAQHGHKPAEADSGNSPPTPVFSSASPGQERLAVPEKASYPVPAWQQAAERSKIPRINWRSILGKSLTKFVAEKLAEGWKRLSIEDYAFHEAVGNSELEQKGWTHEQIVANVKIGVSARIGEMHSEKTAYKTRKAEGLVWRANIIETKAGTRIIGVAKEVPIRAGTLVEVSLRIVEVGHHD